MGSLGTREKPSTASRILHDNAFDNVRRILAFVGCRFEADQDFLALDQQYRVFAGLKKGTDRPFEKIVCLILNAVNPDKAFTDPRCILQITECQNRLVESRDSIMNQPCEPLLIRRTSSTL